MLRNLFRQVTIGEKPMPIIVGSPRSGTTLLRFMVDSHPEITIPAETGFLVPCAELTSKGDTLRTEVFQTITQFHPQAPAWQDFGISKEDFWAKLTEIEPFSASEGVRTFYRLYAARFNKPRWGDKTPSYCLSLNAIQNILPEAHFIHIIRDGRDVALSLRQMWFSPGNDMATLANHWVQCVSTAQKQAPQCKHYMEIHYEDLVLKTQQMLEIICAFLGVKYDPKMENYFERTPRRLEEHKARYYIDGSLIVSHEQRLQQQRLTTEPPNQERVFNWKTGMTAGERSQYEEIAGTLLKALGYEL